MKLRPQAESLSGSPQPNFTAFKPSPIISKRDPATSDTGYPLGQDWINKTLNNAWELTSVSAGAATWVAVGGGTLSLSTLTGDTGTATPVAGNIKLAGTANQIVTSASGSTVTFALTGPYAPATYTAHGVLVGEGTSPIVATSAGTDGQVLTGNTSANPAFANIGTKSGLTAHGVVLGEGASAFAATAAGTTGQVLTATTSMDPAFAALGTNSGLTGLVLGNNNSAFTTTTFTAAGAFTPAFALGTPGDSAWTYSSRVGRYTQMGSVVYFVAQLVWSNFANTTGSGTWQLNLPVAADAIAFTGHIHISGSGVDANAQAANLPLNFTGEIGTGATAVVLSVEEGGTTYSSNALFNLTVTQVLTTGTMNVSGWYFAS